MYIDGGGGNRKGGGGANFIVRVLNSCMKVFSIVIITEIIFVYILFGIVIPTLSFNFRSGGTTV